MEKYNAHQDLVRDLNFYPLGVKEPIILSKIDIKNYNEFGYIYPKKIFSKLEVKKIKKYFEIILAKAIESGWNSYEIHNWHKHCEGIYEIVTENRIVDIVQDLLGESVIMRASQFFVKLPGDKKQVSWHQDASFWPLSKSRSVSVWLAVDEVNIDNGAMQFIPCSHLESQIPYFDTKIDENNVLNQTVINAEKYGGKPVSVDLKPGEISLHSDWTLHRSGMNLSKNRRAGLVIRFVSNDVKAFKGWNVHSVICRGKDPSGHWANNIKPTGETIPQKIDSGITEIPIYAQGTN